MADFYLSGFIDMRELWDLSKEVKKLPDFSTDRIPLEDRMTAFWRRAGDACQLILEEKEILVFAGLQWIVIGLAYFAWVQIFGMFPDHVWEAASREEALWWPNLVLLAATFLIIGIAALPIGVLTACIGAVHLLRRVGETSTPTKCLALVSPNIWPLWIFHWVDGWITVKRIFDRIPEKNDRTTFAERMLSEALYYAWKIGSAGMVPALVVGKGIGSASKASLSLLRHRFSDVALLRSGYSASCWIVGVLAYVGGVLMVVQFPWMFPEKLASAQGMYMAVSFAGIPLMISLVFVVVLLRPIYLIGMADIYANHLYEQNETITLPARSRTAGVTSGVMAGILVVALVGAIVFKDQIGLTELMGRVGGYYATETTVDG